MRIETKAFLKKQTTGAVLLMIVLTLAVYANSLRNSFAWDDYIIIVDNDFIKSWKNFPAIFSRGYLAPASGKEYLGMVEIGSGEVSYRPVVTITYFIDYSLWRLNPFGYHLSNLILHIFNVILLYFLVGLIARDKKIALLTSLFFGLHPINSEAVNAIAFREDLLAFLFFTFSFILFIKSDYYQKIKRAFLYISSIILYLLALFSKEMAISLPLLLIVYDYYFVFEKDPKRLLSSFKSRYLGYIASSLAYLWVWSLLMSGNIKGFIKGYPGGSLYTNLLTMSKVFVTYIKWLLMPTNIHVTMPGDTSYIIYSFFEPEVLVSISLIIACLILSIAVYRKSKLFSFAILWSFISLLPVSNILPLSNMMASRYLYIPGVGFYLLVAVLLDSLLGLRLFSILPNILKRVSTGVMVGLLIFYSVFTIIRNSIWRNDITFWLEAVEHYPANAKVHRNLGGWFIRNGLLDKAIVECKKAISLDPDYIAAYNDLGACYIEKRLYKEAIDCFKQVLKLDPDCAPAHYNLGVVYTMMKKYDDAEKAFEKTLAICPEHKPTQVNLEKLRQHNH